jgi:flagellar basal-body rod modification protein FlgD
MSVSAITRATAVQPSAAAASGSTGSGGKSFEDLMASMRTDGAAAAAGADPKLSAGTDETEDRFLKLLVAQMKNQDPLNPLDNAQVTTQLAQINTVKGIDKLNASMTRMLERASGGSATEAAAMVGRSVLIDGDRLELAEGGVARGGFQLAESASVARIDVFDASGTLVDSRIRNNLPAGLQIFQWDGKVGSKLMDPGSYTLRITAANASRQVEATPLSAAPVQAVVRGAEGISLQLGAFGTKPLSDVRGIL